MLLEEGHMQMNIMMFGFWIKEHYKNAFIMFKLTS